MLLETSLEIDAAGITTVSRYDSTAPHPSHPYCMKGGYGWEIPL